MIFFSQKYFFVFFRRMCYIRIVGETANKTILLKAGEAMTYTANDVTYRIAFDTESNHFLAIDAHNEARVATGVTIEEAVRNLRG
ncbi:hypothetical protein [Enterococcus asini]|nr:hypothetical protein [Enterococcus asini]RGW11826.1 hypothetical protein DWV91_11180 [Enterococcus asini]